MLALTPSSALSAAEEKPTAPRPAPATTTATSADAKLLERGRGKLHDDDFDEAIRIFKQIFDLPKSDVKDGAIFYTALALEKRAAKSTDGEKRAADEKEALVHYQKCADSFPDSPFAADSIIRIGNMHLKQQRYKEAAEYFLSFQQARPTHRLSPLALFLAAQCAYKLGDFKSAAERFTKVIDTYPDVKDLRAEAMYWLGDAFLTMHDINSASRAFKRLIAAYPESEWARAAKGRLTEEVFAPTRGGF